MASPTRTHTHTHTQTPQISEEDSGEGGLSAEDTQQRHDLEEKLRQLREAELMVRQLEEENKSKGGPPLQNTDTRLVHTHRHRHTYVRTYVPYASMPTCLQPASCPLQMIILLMSLHQTQRAKREAGV